MTYRNQNHYFAHSTENTESDKWQPLDEHLHGVASLSEKFAAKFKSKQWGYISGLWHDLGKYQNKFQKRIQGENIAVEHAGVGARLAYEKWGNNAIPIAMAIAGHHTGLPNLQTTETGLAPPLLQRLQKNKNALQNCTPAIPQDIINHDLPGFPDALAGHAHLHKDDQNNLLYMREMWVRFLFSCVVDADRLDTACFCAPEREKKRGGYDDIETLRHRCDQYIDQKIAGLSDTEKNLPINLARQKILRQCREAALARQGLFSLTVPTGGGKTLSGMSFALNHAVENDLQRVIVVIPYTSIIEQNALVYQNCMGAENVLEHHTNLDPKQELRKKGDEITEKHGLASENWDAPVVVTTTVQFFESLFAARPAKTRKLHNISQSVIILDEVQALPPGLLNPILDGLKQLRDFYNCSIVLSTATLPALSARPGFDQGLPEVKPIIEENQTLSKALQRVEIHWPDKPDPLGLEELATELNDYNQVLCVVNKRKDARELAEMLEQKTDEPVFHLSALMCPAHRLSIIEQIRQTLQQNEQICRVISTQLIEAGVDLDFPVVYRAMAGLDSIIQAAGRCNREGKIRRGKVVVFKSTSKPPPGVPAKAVDIMKGMLREFDTQLDPDDPEINEHYFKKLYFNSHKDVKNIQANRREFNFATVGRDFKLIEDGYTFPVIVPWKDAENRLARLREAISYDLPFKDHLRALQPYTVNIYQHSFKKLNQAGALEEIVEGIFALSNTHKYLYDSKFGLVMGDEAPPADPESLIVGI